jgi:hypothetical protein
MHYHFELPGFGGTPGKPSKVIRRAKRVIKPGDFVVLWCRVSHRSQARNRNLTNQEVYLRKRMAKLRAIIVDVVRHVGPGWSGFHLKKAVGLAKEHNAKLVTVCTSRFVRHLDWHSQNAPHLQPTVDDIKSLKAWTKGVTIATVLHPNASQSKERSVLTRIGQMTKGKYGGRERKTRPGDKKRRRDEKLSTVLEHHKQGCSSRDIARKVGLPKSTVNDWVRWASQY